MIYPIRKIVAGILRVDGEDPVLAAALELARTTSAELHLVHSFELPALTWDAYGRMGYVGTDVLDNYSRTLRDQLEATSEEIGDGVDIHAHAIAAPAAAAIVDTATEVGADLIVTGATRHSKLGQALLGTTAQRVLRRARVPVLVIRDQAVSGQRVLLTTDLTPFSAGIHELGLDVLETMLGRGPAQVRSLVVVRDSLGFPAPFDHDQVTDIAGRELRRFIDLRRDRDSKLESLVRVGDPAEEIAAEARSWGANLIVVGTHSRTVAERWILGSVAEATIRECKTNVLVIPSEFESARELPVPVASSEAPATPRPA